MVPVRESEGAAGATRESRESGGAVDEGEGGLAEGGGGAGGGGLFWLSAGAEGGDMARGEGGARYGEGVVLVLIAVRGGGV